MSITFTAGYIEVFSGDTFLSRHRQEREAVEAILALDLDGEYEIRTAPVKVIVKRRITGPDAPALGPVLTISDTELSVTLDRPATGPTRIDRYELERYSGSAWVQIASGVNIFGAGMAYPDTGLTASTDYDYRCRVVDTTERASEYSYSFGTTSAGAVNSAPVWQSGTVSVSVQAGSSVSVSGYCSDPEGDPLTYTLVSTSPTTSTISVSASGVVSTTNITPTGVNSIVVRASDGLLTANKTIALTVTAASSGDTYYIESGVATYNASQVQPGDTVILRAGTRGALTITNLNGSLAAPITVTNESGGLVRITASSGALLTLQTPKHVVLDGSNGTPTASDGTACGILVRPSTANTYSDQAVKCLGYWQDLTIRSIEVDARISTFTAANSGVGISTNDQSAVWGAVGGENLWKDGLLIENCHIHNIGGEAIYAGGNYSTQHCPLRNCIIQNNWVHDSGRDCINVKAWWEGDNYIRGNLLERSGRKPFSSSESGQGSGLSLLSARATVYNNIIIDSGEVGIKFQVINGPFSDDATTPGNYPPYANWPVDVYNNLIVNAGVRNSGDGIKFRQGAAVTGSTLVPLKPDAYNNTVVNCGAAGVTNADGSNEVLPGFVCNNVLISNAVATDLIGQMAGTDTNNKTTGTLTADYRLTSESAAVGTIGVDISDSDIEGTSRAGTASKGAYEYA